MYSCSNDCQWLQSAEFSLCLRTNWWHNFVTPLNFIVLHTHTQAYSTFTQAHNVSTQAYNTSTQANNVSTQPTIHLHKPSFQLPDSVALVYWILLIPPTLVNALLAWEFIFQSLPIPVPLLIFTAQWETLLTHLQLFRQFPWVLWKYL